MRKEKICDNPECGKKTRNKKFCSRECTVKVNLGVNNPMKKKEVREKMSEILSGRDITWGDKISESLRTSEKAKQLHFKRGEDNPAYGNGHLQRGELNPNWKGGRSTTNQLIRTSDKYKEWRKYCMERDGYKCTKCGTGGYLQVHHIKELAEYPDLAYDYDNGLTVCLPCHNEIHGRQIGKLTKEQSIELKMLIRDNPDNLTMREMGELFGVSLETVKNIKYKKTWKHIEIPK